MMGTRIGSLSHTLRYALAASLVVSVFGQLLYAQEVHIRVLNGRTGRPITNECLNVWVGPLHGEGLLAPTNDEGVVVIHLGNDQVTADAVSRRACGENVNIGPKPVANRIDTITVSGGNYVTCQEHGKVRPGDAANPNLLSQLMPSYAIMKILESGVSAANTCGKVRADAKPGELVIFERPTTFGERLKQ